MLLCLNLHLQEKLTALLKPSYARVYARIARSETRIHPLLQLRASTLQGGPAFAFLLKEPEPEVPLSTKSGAATAACAAHARLSGKSGRGVHEAYGKV